MEEGQGSSCVEDAQFSTKYTETVLVVWVIKSALDNQALQYVIIASACALPSFI